MRCTLYFIIFPVSIARDDEDTKRLFAFGLRSEKQLVPLSIELKIELMMRLRNRYISEDCAVSIRCILSRRFTVDP